MGAEWDGMGRTLGVWFNGRNFNGRNFNGRNFNGRNFNGRNFNGRNFNGRYPLLTYVAPLGLLGLICDFTHWFDLHFDVALLLIDGQQTRF